MSMMVLYTIVPMEVHGKDKPSKRGLSFAVMHFPPVVQRSCVGINISTRPITNAASNAPIIDTERPGTMY